jgi:hypothetical protein
VKLKGEEKMRKINKNKTLVSILSILIVALFIGTTVSSTIAQNLKSYPVGEHALGANDEKDLLKTIAVDDTNEDDEDEEEQEIVTTSITKIEAKKDAVKTEIKQDSVSSTTISKENSAVLIKEETACPLCAKQEASKVSSDNEMELILMRDYGFTSEEITVLKEGISGLKATVSDYQDLSISEKQELIRQYGQEFSIDVSGAYDQTKMQVASIVEHKDAKSVPRLSARVSVISSSSGGSTAPIGGGSECNLETFFNSCSGLFGDVVDNLWLWMILILYAPEAAVILFLFLLDFDCGGLSDNRDFTPKATMGMQTNVAVQATAQTCNVGASSSSSSQTSAL